MDNLTFFKNNVEYYSSEYRDYELKEWERKIVLSVSGDVLDVACGGGRITVPMLRAGHNVYATDFVSEFGSKIREHQDEFLGRFKFFTANMTKLPFNDKTFETVTCINSIVYLRNISELYKSISEMSRVLKPYGKIFITTWNIYHPYWAISVLLNYILRNKRFGETSPFFKTDKRIKNSLTYMYVPSRRILERVCEGAGLKISIETGTGSILHPILVISGVKIE